ncbi:type III secretion system chaperone family protein [Mangrovibrevibacter kandeliae]|uniref:YbjN domain-containing protein n=1 Tax=Mangrovibrevibacter kandeliae TaxID=2968473 RepID=UPI002118035F|nr:MULTISPECIES: YbjN domain-containing protein [unclassified Aurantimonas]MCQ8781030.1 YbjN domain-containing protein [Aurantimonas sp. CSK15Z-1]MCW4113812.1 YbjN domain-containing protein [Aurantimonas sp. MSK8Z-1]
MNLGEVGVERDSNPVDLIEVVASARDWSFERSGDDEIAVSVAGVWTSYQVSFSWLEDYEALHLGCAFDMKIPAHREAEVLKLLSRINEQLLIGHFDLWPQEGAVMFRHALLLSGGAEPTSQQAEQLLTCALECCERYYQAFQFVVWANKDAEEALACAVFETVGHA